MSRFYFFRRPSAPIARERLQILLAHERIACSHHDLLGILRDEILTVIGRYVSYETNKVQIKMNRRKSVSTLAVDIEIPNGHPSGALRQYNRLTFDPGHGDSVSGMGLA